LNFFDKKEVLAFKNLVANTPILTERTWFLTQIDKF